MMKKILGLMGMVSSVATAQNRDNIWMLSTYSVNEQSLKSGIDFSSGSADTFSIPRAMGFFITDASICDTDGNLLFYTNGIWIANKNHDTLLNSENFNPGFWTDWYSPDGLGMEQGSIVIPRPTHANEYYLF